MQNKKFLFILGAVAAMVATSCGGGPTHEPSETLRFYHADLNHDGRIAPFKIGETEFQESNLTWKEAYDTLLEEANSTEELSAIADAMDIADDEINRTSLARYEILHEAEELLMHSQAFMPLYNYADPYLLKPSIDQNALYTTALGFKFFNQLKDTKDLNKKEFSVSLGTKATTFDPGNNTDSTTANIICNAMIGVNRWVNVGNNKAEYKAGGGVASYVKKLVVATEAEEDENHIWIGNCPDLKDLDEDEKDNYYNTARYEITIKEDANWSDGEPVTAFDFTYAWDRASSNVYSGADMGMLTTFFDCIRGSAAWNAIGQQTTKDTTKWDEKKQTAWKALSNSQKKEWEYAYDQKCNYQTKDTKTLGGLAGVMLADDNTNKTFIVQLVNDCDYFDQLLAFPAFYPVPTKKIITGRDENGRANKESSTWCFSPSTYPTTGAFKFTKIDNTEAGEVVLEKNDKTIQELKDETIVNKVTFKLIDDDSAMYQSYDSGALQMIDNVAAGIIDKVKGTPDWHVADQIGLYFCIFNVNDNTFDVKPNTSEDTRRLYRKILNLLVNRYDITENVVKTGATPANGVVTTGIIERCIPEDTPRADGKWHAKHTNPEDDDSPLVSADWHTRNGDTYDYLKEDDDSYKLHRLGYRNNNAQGYGFYDVANKKGEGEGGEKTVQQKNIEKAIEIGKTIGLKWEGDVEHGGFVNFPQISITTNSGTGHESIYERMQAYYSLFNINMSIEIQEWNAFTAARHSGSFAIARHGWVADYSDPRTYLDLARSYDGNNDSQLGKKSTHRSH